ncbi:MAG TPA: Hsp70 family protein, partial [Polyangiaceae bacterium]|nr:Hsp70 family protein [Polyangiaceae bacterium]
AFPPLTEKSTPIARAHHPAATAEPRELAVDNTLDDFVDPLTTEPTKPRFSVDMSLASAAVREDAPKSHRPSSRPSARQNIDELELPVPNLPLRQSTPSFGSPSEDFLSTSGPLNAEKVRSPDESTLSSRRPEPTVRPPASAVAPEPSRLVSAGSTGRATIPFGQPPAPFAQGHFANPPSANAGKSQVAPGPLDLELPPLVAPVPRAYSTSGRPVLLIDVTPLSLCVETVGGYVDVVVNRNTPVPCERTREYVTAQDNQQIVNIRVAQGESRLFDENVQLGEVQLSGIATGVRGQTRIAVTFGIDADGLLHVRAMDVTSGKSAIADLRLAGVSGAHELAQPPARLAGKA